jgi:hypothetical protein
MLVSHKVVKYLLFGLLIAGTAYPILELSRLIIIVEIILRMHPEIPVYEFYVEIVVMWLFYIFVMVTYIKLVEYPPKKL